VNRKRIYIMVAFAVVLAMAYQPLFSREDLTEQIDATYTRLIKYRAAAANTGGDNTGAENLKRLAALEKGLLPGTTTARAVARLQTEITGLADGAGLAIASLRPLTPEVIEPYRQITVQVSMTGDLVQLRDFLRDLETTETLMRIVTLNVRVTNIRNPETLRVKIAIAGIMKV